jgi:hypothetical protein
MEETGQAMRHRWLFLFCEDEYNGDRVEFESLRE